MARPAVVLVSACAAQFMVVLDVSVVNVALPSIRDALAFDHAGLQWVVSAYALTFAGLLLVGGRLADLYGHRRVFVLGLALFSGASLVGGLATAPALLIVARGVQGAGAAVLAPAALTLITTGIPEGARRTRALAAWTAVGLAGGTAGNLVGGLLTEALSWRWTLLINVPVGAGVLVAAVRSLPADPGRHGAPRLDLPGAATVTAGLVALTYGISRAGTRGWDDPVTLAALAAAAAGLAAFALVETRHAAVPLIPPHLVRHRAILTGNAAMLLAGACLNPMWYFLSLSMGSVLHYGALEIGLGFLPHTVLTIAVALRVTPWLMGRIDGRVLVGAGALVAAAGLLWQGRLDPGDSYVTGILGPGVLVSVGGGLLNTPLTGIVTSGVSRRDAGAASGLMNTAKQAGGALGLAVLTTSGDAYAGMAAIAVGVAAVTLSMPNAPAVAAGASGKRISTGGGSGRSG
ncbi:MFS transporter [Spirillospora sp. CA-294931]|uniref:MFS transporter n=1 Tax=Spirillospora sp. CA-294931 TaxID=3240042 RepID=UPI003D93F50A